MPGPLGAKPNVEFQKNRGSSKHEALLAAASEESLGLIASNAPDFRQPFGPPVFQVCSEEGEWMTSQVQNNSPVDMVVSAERLDPEPFHMTGRVTGANQDARPLLVMTPHSGRWQ